jgi:hypothetical protein
MSNIIIAFRATAELANQIKCAAASEGLSASDVTRRAVLRDLAGRPFILEPFRDKDAANSLASPASTVAYYAAGTRRGLQSRRRAHQSTGVRGGRVFGLIHEQSSL